MPLSVHVVTAEREVFADDAVDELVAPGSEGEFTVLPQHAPLLTMIKPGIMRIVKGGEETDMAITGGFIEVRDDRVTVLADAVERTEEIDVARAEEARRRAEQSLTEKISSTHVLEAQAALARAMLRIKAVERRRHRREGGRPQQRPPGA